MPSTIQTLPQEVIHLIAAGEVIDSLAAVVRELIENSLDAGATRIVISLFPDLWRVQVADNGQGMSLEDLRLCTQAHSTSKIHTTDDLWKITSLGFRGEALHSLVQLAEVEILSCRESGEGWRVRYSEQGEKIEEEFVAIAPGTIVTVSNLFGNVPLRRKGLPSRTQQLKMIQETIQNIALCHPTVTWQVFHQNQLWFHLSPSSTAQQILPQLIKRVRFTDLQSVSLDIPTPQDSFSLQNPTSKIELVIGLPDRCHRGRPDWIKVAVNGRLVRSPQLEQAILAAFMKTLPRDRYPICFLHLKTCPSQIDWNRHPSKIEIYLHSLKFWEEKVSQAINQALRINPETLPNAVNNQRVETLLKAAEASGNYHLSREIETTLDPENNPNDLSLLELRAIAQVHNTYIVAEHPTGIWLIEQHIAHERVLYEKLVNSWELVPLDNPIILHELKDAQIEQLTNLGLEIEAFGEQLWAVRNAPEMLSQREDCANALLELSVGGNLQEAQVVTACRSAIRNGTPLDLCEMQSLLDQWKQTRNPRTCPHGRPIYLSLEETSLARFFKRHWVIGKSHGIENRVQGSQ